MGTTRCRTSVVAVAPRAAGSRCRRCPARGHGHGTRPGVGHGDGSVTDNPLGDMDFNRLRHSRARRPSRRRRSLRAGWATPSSTLEHLLLALLDQELPQQLVPDAAELRSQAEAGAQREAVGPGMQQQPNVSAAFSRVLDQAADEAKRLEDDYVSTEHLLLALDVVPREISSRRRSRRCAAASASPRRIPKAPTRRSRSSAATSPPLPSEGKLDPVIGRDEEIRRVIQVLSRRTKNNPVLIGDPGVGKTAIVEGPRAAHRRRRRPGGPEGQARLGARHRRAARRLEVPRRVRGAAEGRAERDQVRRGPRSSSSSTSCTRSSAPARPKAPSTRANLLKPMLAARRAARASARRRSTSTASTSRRTRRSSAASSRSSSASRRSPTRSRSCAA